MQTSEVSSKLSVSEADTIMRDLPKLSVRTWNFGSSARFCADAYGLLLGVTLGGISLFVLQGPN